tara:strand:+ start:1455 stop:2108 length:654 start_codon:yes stop_codon:yes gene_type:complete
MLETDLSYPLIVEVTLFKHNLMDSRFLSEIRRNARITKVENSQKHFFVPVGDIKEILDTKFKDEVLYQNGLSDEDLVKNINSAFFLHSVVTTFTSLKYIKFSVSNKKNYTRRKGNQISFDYKILHAKIDLPALVANNQELRDIQKLLIAIKFWKPNKFHPKPFIEVSSRDLINQIQYHEGSDTDFATEYNEAISALLRYIDMKLESDNSSLQVIVMN